MNNNILFTRTPEQYYFINYIPYFNQSNTSLVLILGLLLIVVVILTLTIFYFKKNSFIKQKSNYLVIFLILLVQLPLHFNAYYNNFYDLYENSQTIKKSYRQKLITRLCKMDDRQNLNGAFCHLPIFFSLVKDKVPLLSSIQFLVTPNYDHLFKYFLYPTYKISESADYLIFYRPADYSYKNNYLYKNDGGKDVMVGSYDLIGALDNNEIILKK